MAQTASADEAGVGMAERLRRARASQLMTQEDLAEASGVSRPTIARIELGTVTPRMKTVRSLAMALGVEPSVLVPVVPEGWTRSPARSR